MFVYQFDQHHNKIGYSGDSHPTLVPWLTSHSLYCGKTCEEVIETFELAYEGYPMAAHIRRVLGFGPESVADTPRPIGRGVSERFKNQHPLELKRHGISSDPKLTAVRNLPTHSNKSKSMRHTEIHRLFYIRYYR